MKILIIVDKEGTAIDRLAKSVQRNLPYHQIVVFPVHPKRPDIDTFINVQKLMEWADVIDVHYWKSGKVIREQYTDLFMSKPRVLFHFNPYDVQSEENQYYDRVIVGNKEMHNKIPYAYYIPYAIDLSFFKFSPEYNGADTQTVMMSVNRIEGKKGVEEVAKVCKELGYKFLLVGRVSKPEYMQQVRNAAGDSLEFHEGVTDETLREMYYQSTVHVCNSTDGFESGTLPILEAMACGVPVLTRMIGHVPDIYNGSNLIIRVGQPEDLDDLKVQLKLLMENKMLRQQLRGRAWDTVRTRDDRRMALEVQKMYYAIYRPNTPLVSVIIPTKDHPESFTECLVSIVQQDYPKFEIVVADSGETPVKMIVDKMKQQTSVPIKYIHFPHKDNYTLAEARNRAVIEADGQILVFCDDRLKVKPNVLMVYATYSRPKSWLWGMKDGVTKGFVENFSSVRRDDLVAHGMFNERIQWYGGMTQDIRERFETKNNFDFICMPEAQAESIQRATSKSKRREDIVDAKFLLYKLYNK